MGQESWQRRIMKSMFATALLLAVVPLAGCASGRNVLALRETVGPGPAPTGRPQAGKEGSLQVFSARQSAYIDLNEAVFRENNDFGKNDFLYTPAHTDYSIYTQGGRFVEHVRNSRDQNDSEPTLVRLPAGLYEVKAEAEVGGSSASVLLPVKISAGLDTMAHLQGDWKPGVRAPESELVRLPDGQIIGWRDSATPRSRTTAFN